ncbi:copper oxidase [Sorangium sp. So ce134]
MGCADSDAPFVDEEVEQSEQAVIDASYAPASGRTVYADVVAIDQLIVYDRFDAFNPGGMVYALRRDVEAADPSRPVGPGNAALRPGKRPRPLVLRVNAGDNLVISFTNWLTPSGGALPALSPATRDASIHVVGLQIRDIAALGGNVGQNESSLAAPGETRTYELVAGREGAFLMHSGGAMAGADGTGRPLRQISQSLFGAVIVEPKGAVAYRSQVTAEELKAASDALPNPDGTPRIHYDALDASGEPILRIINDEGEIVHGDLNAIITDFDETEVRPGTSASRGYFREFTVMFHDDLGSVQAFPELQRDPIYHSVRSGFGINYGAASLGGAALANRRKIGPTRGCAECKFEEFFLSSWANGDPALNIERDEAGNAVRALYPDDPSNVSHAYLGDPVRIRNLHAGPTETHVFHAHGHQWLRSPNNDDSAYIDSQTIGPRAAFTYDMSYGGGGNRNLTAGDAIYHCHLYPHFVQGMWGLWRNHDVFEAGTPDRNLPDGELASGTPTPAVVPIPELAMAPMPTYEPTSVSLPDRRKVMRKAMPGYPYYVAGLAGHRPPQPPRDIEHDGGLPRHLITSVPPDGDERGVRGTFDAQIHRANVKLLPPDGTDAEVAAAEFHAGWFPGAVSTTARYGFPVKGYPAFTPGGAPALFLVNGQPPAAGAPYADPCPPGAPVRTYRAAYVQIDATVNRAGWHDPQARTIVLEQDYAATIEGTRPPEPLFIRAGSGECVVFHATNTIPDVLEADDFQMFTPTDTVGQHIHLVKYDVTSSDGGANGFNYEDGTFAAQEVVARISAANALGGALAADGTVRESGARVTLAATRNPRLPAAPLGAQTTTQRWWADPVVTGPGKERPFGTAFTHDHFSASSHQHHGLYAALVVEPAGSTWRDPTTGDLFGARDDGGPTSYRADILFPAGDKRTPFREYNLSFADYAIVYDECGRPVNSPATIPAPLPQAIAHGGLFREPVSWRDPGAGLINYRHEPIPLRIADRDCATGATTPKAGDAGEMHNVFSSKVHGDPATPLLRAYKGDRAVIRLTQGAQSEQHIFSLHGKKWLRDGSDPDSGFSNGQPIGVSEAMDIELAEDPLFAQNSAGGADYLYQSATTDDLWEGMWGLMRVHGERVPDLLPLPHDPSRSLPSSPPAACPPDAKVREYVVHAISAAGNLPGDRLTYNKEYKLYDPDAILFVHEADLSALRLGRLAPEPLILRAAAGECVKVTLVNDLPESPPKTPHWNYNPPIVEGFNVNQVKTSNRVSLHPQLVAYNVNTSDGANVGQNADQTVAPGGRRTYTWYAGDVSVSPLGDVTWRPVEFGAINLKDMADVVNHGMHGAIGALIVEPANATWYPKPNTRASLFVSYRDQAGVERWFREVVLFYQDEVALHSDDARFQCADASLNCGTALRNIVGDTDADGTGHKAFNYLAEPLWARLGVPPERRIGELPNLDMSGIFSSMEHGDPATPLFTVGRYDTLRVRVLQPSGHRRQHSFSLWGAEWAHNPWAQGSASRAMGPNPASFAIGAQSGIGPMTAWNVNPFFRAGGLLEIPGDRLYLDQASFQLAGGLWGIVRVTE